MSTSDHRRFKDRIYEQLARPTKALSAPKRLELLDLLCQGPRTVERLAEQTALSVANASRHLQVLREARLVESEKRGLFVEYRIADDEVAQLLHALRQLAHARLGEIDKLSSDYFASRGALEPIASAELLQRVKRGDVTLLDVRPAEEYRAGHVPGALSIPVAELKTRLKELSKSRAIVAYCRGPYCVMALEAVELLRKRGFDAQHMAQGIVEWRALGQRVEQGEARA